MAHVNPANAPGQLTEQRLPLDVVLPDDGNGRVSAEDIAAAAGDGYVSALAGGWGCIGKCAVCSGVMIARPGGERRLPDECVNSGPTAVGQIAVTAGAVH